MKQKAFYISSLLDLVPVSLLIHFSCDVVGPDKLPLAGGSSAGSAAAELVKAFKTRNASIGERSRVPPSGGMSPRNMFKYGSHIVLKGKEFRVS